ncbi:putative ubiquitin-conjugating enzyme E2 38 [Malania oleifera]|uniref:putative ubiquitin-conjugating enzyme E2 38 n=1 Tax=Malania oleifera TaxID=397392 RepID=UPI0025AE6885|nr:putative ubiquitin-conjugating enzyme E2 38 [Malania oleifera]XP_057953703.1 putative ubiquitin-conjugating enzyme E2 38 [Malania oleifera]
MDLDVDEFTFQTTPQSSISKKIKQNEVLYDIAKAGSEENQPGALVSDENVNMPNKGMGKEIVCDMSWENQVKDALANNLINPTSLSGSVDGVVPLKSSASESINSINVPGSSSDFSSHNDNENNDDDNDAGGDIDDISDDDASDDYYYYDDEVYPNLQAQFDKVDFPPGVEASVPWLKAPVPTENMPDFTSTSTFPTSQACSDGGVVPVGGETSVSLFSGLAESKKGEAGSSSFEVRGKSTFDGKDEGKDEVVRKFEDFKCFDTVEDFSDHHFNDANFGVEEQANKNWAKKIQEEWKILEKDLPDTIFVRVCESRMDLLRAAIIGPGGTPYHDGLFFFDIFFPSSYPIVPPMVYYYSGGLRLNPNLYECGKVCLSLLNTWNGQKTEKWIPRKSTMLQVLVSIQALILNENPFFNEPGFESTYKGNDGVMRSKQYNADVFILSLKTMMYTLRRPPKNFEDFVAGHFRCRAHDILAACKAYIDGAEVGSMVKGVQNVEGADKGHWSEFKTTVAKMMNLLITAFTKNGSEGCEQFRLPA